MKMPLATPCGTPWCAVTGVEAACTIALAFMLNAMPAMVLASDSCSMARGSRVVDGGAQVGADHADGGDVERVEQRIGAGVDVRLDRVARARRRPSPRSRAAARCSTSVGIDERQPRGECGARRRRA